MTEVIMTRFNMFVRNNLLDVYRFAAPAVIMITAGIFIVVGGMAETASTVSAADHISEPLTSLQPSN